MLTPFYIISRSSRNNVVQKYDESLNAPEKNRVETEIYRY